MLVTMLVWSGCAPRDPLDVTISSHNTAAYNDWSYRTLTRLSPVAQAEFRNAQREILLTIQFKHAGMAPADQRELQRALLHGHSAREVIVEGYTLRLTRLRAADAEDTVLLKLNAERILSGRMTPRSADYLADRMGPIKDRQAERRAEIKVIEARLEALEKRAGASPDAPSPSSPDTPETTNRPPSPPVDPRHSL